jgi:hypothetical protein
MSRAAALLLLVCATGAPLSAQTLAVRLLDAKSGKAISNKNITFHWNSDELSGGTVVRVGKDGAGHVGVPKNATGFFLLEGPKDGKEPFRVAYFDCNAKAEPYTSISEVLSRGVVPRNTCSERSVKAEPGVIVFWGLMRRWYEPDMQ